MDMKQWEHISITFQFKKIGILEPVEKGKKVCKTYSGPMLSKLFCVYLFALEGQNSKWSPATLVSCQQQRTAVKIQWALDPKCLDVHFTLDF